MKHTADETCVEHFVIDQIVSGIPALREVAVVDGQEQDKEHFILGLVTTKSRGVAVEVITDEHTKDLGRYQRGVFAVTGECFVFAGRLVLTCPI